VVKWAETSERCPAGADDEPCRSWSDGDVCVLCGRDLNGQAFEYLTAEDRRVVPPLHSQDGLGERQVAWIKYFTPDSNWTWWVCEACAVLDDGREVALHEANGHEVDVRFFGLVDGHACELGYFVLSELRSVTGPLGLRIERDLYFTPTKLADLPPFRP
jgi:hypothetical protein